MTHCKYASRDQLNLSQWIPKCIWDHFLNSNINLKWHHGLFVCDLLWTEFFPKVRFSVSLVKKLLLKWNIWRFSSKMHFAGPAVIWTLYICKCYQVELSTAFCGKIFCWYEKHVEISEQLRKCWSLYNKKSLVLSLWHSFQLTLMKSFSIKKGHNAFMHIITYWVCLRCWNDFKYLIATYIIWLSANVNINAKLLKKAVFGNNFV